MKQKTAVLVVIFILSFLMVIPVVEAGHKRVKHGHKNYSGGPSNLAVLVKEAEERGEPVIRVLMGRKIVRYPLEMYLVGVIGNEMSRRWPPEALKAQAVAARSYALYRMGTAKEEGRSWDVLPTQADQVFRPRDVGNAYLKSIVEKTRGEVLSSQGNPIAAYYSSTCGGRTRGAVEAGLTQSSPLNKGITDSFCRISPFRDWVIRARYADLQKKFRKKGLSVEGLQSVSVSKKAPSGYVLDVQFETNRGKWTLSGDDFRRVMGSMNLKSLYFDIRPLKDGISISGKGFGHGVGLCQYGAKAMAEGRMSYKKILAKYYPQIKLVKMVDSTTLASEKRAKKTKEKDITKQYSVNKMGLGAVSD